MTTTEVATTEQRPPTLAQLIQQMKPEIAKALPSHMNPERMARIATTVLRQTPALARCTPESFLGALLTASQLGLEPGPTGESYFVPYGQVCTFIPGYRGLIKLARNSGQLIDIWAEIVYANDRFKYTLGLRRDLEHEPAEGERGEPTYVYAAAQLRDGGTPFVVMTVAEVEAIRARSRAGNNGPWKTDWNAMAKKTLIKQLAKWLPLSAEFNTAAVLDESVRTTVGPLVDVQPDYIDGEVGETPAVEAAAPDDAAAAPESPPDPAPANEPTPTRDVAMITKQQSTALNTLLSKEGLGGSSDEERAARLDWVATAVKRPVSSTNDLTKDEASDLIDLLSGAQNGGDK